MRPAILPSIVMIPVPAVPSIETSSPIAISPCVNVIGAARRNSAGAETDRVAIGVAGNGIAAGGIRAGCGQRLAQGQRAVGYRRTVVERVNHVTHRTGRAHHRKSQNAGHDKGSNHAFEEFDNWLHDHPLAQDLLERPVSWMRQQLTTRRRSEVEAPTLPQGRARVNADAAAAAWRVARGASPHFSKRRGALARGRRPHDATALATRRQRCGSRHPPLHCGNGSVGKRHRVHRRQACVEHLPVIALIERGPEPAGR